MHYAIVRNGPKRRKKPENFLADEENRQGYEQAYLLTEKVCKDASVQVPQVPSQVFIFSECLYCMEKISLKLFARLQTRDVNSMSPNPFMWRRQFFFLAEKKNKKSSVRVCGRAYSV